MKFGKKIKADFKTLGSKVGRPIAQIGGKIIADNSQAIGTGTAMALAPQAGPIAQTVGGQFIGAGIKAGAQKLQRL